jgi:tetratricopeptide (TPR) repeat protein
MTLLATNHHQGGKGFCRSMSAILLALSLITVGIVPTPAYAAQDKKEKQDKQDKKDKKDKKDPREMQAREAFAAGSYKEALDIYTKLYAEKLHPTYLRNIGRCYQNLHESDRAISSFREYLRKAKDMPADERAEVEGYIKEMEDLQKQNAEAAKPAPQLLPVAAPPVNPPPQPAIYVQQPAPAPAPEPFYKRTWFWGVVAGVVVAGTVAGLAAGGVFKAKSNNGCPSGTVCLNP